MNIRKIIKETILEDVADSAKLKGADADTAIARGGYLRDKAMQNLSDLGVYGAKGHMAELGIFDREYLSKSGPFGFSFTTEQGYKYSGKAKYDKDLSNEEKTIVLSFENDDPVCFNEKNCYKYLKIKFDAESTHRAYAQKVKKEFPKFWKKVQENSTLQGLQEDYVFGVTVLPYEKLESKNSQVGENYFYRNNLIVEDKSFTIKTQIKIDKIGLKKSSGESFGGEGLNKSEFTKVEGKINIDGDKIKNLFDNATVSKIDAYLRNRNFYAILSQKDKNTLILSDSNKYDKNSEYLLLQSTKPIDVTNPNSWKGVEVKVGNNALGNYGFDKNIKGTIGYLKIVN